MAKKAGMDFVTLTDHETMDGALTLLHHPDFFIGEEVSALFPEYVHLARWTYSSTGSTPGYTARPRAGGVTSTISSNT